MTLTAAQLSDLTERVNDRRREFSIDRLHPLSAGEVRLLHQVVWEWEEEQPPAEDDEARQQAYDNGYQEGLIAAETKAHDEAFTRGFKYALERQRVNGHTDDPDPITEPPQADTWSGASNEKLTWTELSGENGAKQAGVGRESLADAIADFTSTPKEQVIQTLDSMGIGREPSPISPTAAATLGPEHVIVTPLVPRRAALPDPDEARANIAVMLAQGNAEHGFDFTPRAKGNGNLKPSRPEGSRPRGRKPRQA